ncbi:RDD family protein [Pontibacillus litoralis]|uniref:RDD family protein n=1 Tax=Pontibacillus litoralis JSM 072002 TaxID=1385512 RepID=A0A0A5HUP6_9BACI|nr:RDD family protein [Pontibacillus litoralis]KGX87362.1 RDD family protein [Pontibacillus litoralis JSM 072002]
METTEQQTSYNPILPVIQHQKDDIQRFLFAGFGSRFVAYIIDLMVIWGINSIVVHPIIKMAGLQEVTLWINMFSVSNIATTIIFFLYFILMTKFFRATLGKMILGISVVSLADQPLTIGQIIFRECVGRYISMAFSGLPYIVVAFTKRHQGIHDLFADTSVIRNRFTKLNDYLEQQTVDEI